jgi:hypothetical protein
MQHSNRTAGASHTQGLGCRIANGHRRGEKEDDR